MKLIADAAQEPGVTIAPGLVRQVLAFGGNLMMTRFSFAAGAVAEWHNHPHEQVSCIVSGEIDFFMEGQPPQRLSTGCSFYVPSNQKHRVAAIVPTVILDIFSPQREEFLK